MAFPRGADAASVEPALAHTRASIAGALFLPADGSGDSYKFATGMSAYLQGQGVDFRYGVQIRRLAGQGGRIAGVETDQGTLTADAYVVALGGQSPFLLRPLGMTLPIYPLKGYSITADVTDAGRAPQAAIMDEHNKVMISRLGSRIRAAGMAE